MAAEKAKTEVIITATEKANIEASINNDGTNVRNIFIVIARNLIYLFEY